jgi:hypothetical protein
MPAFLKILKIREEGFMMMRKMMMIKSNEKLTD